MSNSRTPGPTGVDGICYANAMGPHLPKSPYLSDFLLGDTPGSLGVQDGATPTCEVEQQGRAEMPVLCLNVDSVTRLLRSTAFAMAQERAIRVHWKEYEESLLINMISALFYEAKPGHAEIDFGTREEISRNENAQFEKLADTFSRKSSEGPETVLEYLAGLERIRASALGNIESTVRDVQNINAEVVEKTRKTVANLTRVKAASTMFLAGTVVVLTGGAAGGAAWATSAGAAGWVYTGYGVTASVVKTWDEARSAQVVAIAKEGAKTGVEKAGEVIDAAGKANVQRAAEHSAKVEILNKKIAIQHDKLAAVNQKRLADISKNQAKNLKNRAGRYKGKIKSYKGDLSGHQAAASKAGTMGKLMRGAGIIMQLTFASLDFVEAAHEFADTFNEDQEP